MATESFAQAHPEMVASWVTPYDVLSPLNVSAASGRKVEWKCESGHVWRKSVAERVRYPQCPGCMISQRSGVTQGVDDLETLYPDVAALWDSERNVAFPHDVSPRSKSKVYWKHVERPVAVTTKVLEYKDAHRSVAEVAPDLARWFAPDSPVRPDEVTPGSRVIARFACPKGHYSWDDTVRYVSRRSDAGRCPVCSFRVVVPGVNDIATTHPEIAGSLADDQLACRLSEKSSGAVEWVCHKGHTYSLSVVQRLNGAQCTVCLNKVVVQGVNDLATTRPDVLAYWSPENTVSPSSITAGSEEKIALQCISCGDTYWTRAYVATRSRSTRTCRSCLQTSAGEVELAQFVESLGFTVERNTRKVIPPLEIDIWVPERNIGFEFNGVYWHSESNVDKDAHRVKWDAADRAGIQLVCVWEDDWNDRQEVVKAMLMHKLGVSQKDKVGARECSVTAVHADSANAFLDSNHIQGSLNGCRHIGLSHEGQLVAVMSYRHKGSELHVERYATSCNVPGGFTRLLKGAVSASGFTGTVVSFADRTVSTGGLYEGNGFTAEATIPPDYQYLVQGRRSHKFNYRKARFAADDSLVFDDTMTEAQLADVNGLTRVWDAGKVRFIKTV